MRQSAMTISERAELLARHAIAHARQVDLLATVDRDPEHAPPEVLQELRHWGEEIGGLWERYSGCPAHRRAVQKSPER